MIAPITRSIADTALAFEAMAGPDPRNPDSALVESGSIDPSEQRIAFSSKQAFDIPSIRSLPKGWKPLLNISAKEDCRLSGVTQPGRRAQENVGAAATCGTCWPLRHGLPKESRAFDPDVARQIERCLSLCGVEVTAALRTSSAIRAAFAKFFCEFGILLAKTVPCVA